MDKSQLPPWLKSLWRELTKPPAMLGTTKMSAAPRSAPKNTEKERVAAEEDTEEHHVPSWRAAAYAESPTDPFLQKRMWGTEQRVKRIAQRYFHSRQQQKPASKPRPKSLQTRRGFKTARPVAAAEVTTSARRAEARKSDATLIATLRRKEEDTLLSSPLSDAYGQDIVRMTQVANIWRMELADGSAYALKKTSMQPERITFMADALDQLSRSGLKVPTLLRTPVGKPFVTERSARYYAARFMQGKPARFENVIEVGAVARALARLHQMSQNLHLSGYEPPAVYQLEDLLEQRATFLQQFSANKTSLDLNETVQPRLDEALTLALTHAQEALSLFSLPAAQDALKSARQQRALCHLDVTPRNVIIHPEGRAQLIDFDRMTYAPPALDLAHLLRRAMQATGTWSSEITVGPLLAYNRIRPLHQGEYVLIEALLTFPHRLYRILASLMDERMTEAQRTAALPTLTRAIDEEAKRHAFLETYARQVTRRLPAP
ncbi:aminoglycoside phosphotransferase family protein [Ferroacidibacillus organovorans]|uniref:Aminoglycoside phosphotransferase domain-containing protein n=1 Tax=Ferroacidibacillus organovorans TaxID=1765683 RepID=A0A117SYL5_9BACL|nr:aminoglycoside phosphotransferase family protein [Ferroacidibacillus organovorans]KUO97131.1 hypothetical protein ATW55_12550 [Ferroacidibacillus organovorans]